MLDEDTKLIQAAYWEFEEPWQAYRSKTGDGRDASKCGDANIRESAKRFLELFGRFKSRYPAEAGMFWGISMPSGKPFLFELARPREPQSQPSAASC